MFLVTSINSIFHLLEKQKLVNAKRMLTFNLRFREQILLFKETVEIESASAASRDNSATK